MTHAELRAIVPGNLGLEPSDCAGQLETTGEMTDISYRPAHHLEIFRCSMCLKFVVLDWTDNRINNDYRMLLSTPGAPK